MTTTIHTSIEILGKLYPIRCPEPEVKLLQQAAKLLNEKMTEVKDSGKVINIERIAIIAALNIARQFLEVEQQKITNTNKINHRLTQLQDKLDAAINKAMQSELIYVIE
jgi:cell division protein ZapA